MLVPHVLGISRTEIRVDLPLSSGCHYGLAYDETQAVNFMSHPCELYSRAASDQGVIKNAHFCQRRNSIANRMSGPSRL